LGNCSTQCRRPLRPFCGCTSWGQPDCRCI
jgi:hypothetical protein